MRCDTRSITTSRTTTWDCICGRRGGRGGDRAFRKSLAIYPKLQPLRSLALALAGQGKQAEAIPYYEAALRQQPMDAVLPEGSGDGPGPNRQARSGHHALPDGAGTDPGDIEARNNLGIALAMQQQWDKAVEQFRECSGRTRTSRGRTANLAYALASQHKLPEAIEEYREVLAVGRRMIAARQGWQRTGRDRANWREGPVKQFREGLRVSPESPSLHYLWAWPWSAKANASKPRRSTRRRCA